MRLKLVFIASLIAAVFGAGVGIAIVQWTIGRGAFLDPQFSRRSHGWLEVVILIPPIVLALFGGFFVYRHTARRRKFQAALTVILTIVLALAVHIAAVFVL